MKQPRGNSLAKVNLKFYLQFKIIYYSIPIPSFLLRHQQYKGKDTFLLLPIFKLLLP